MRPHTALPCCAWPGARPGARHRSQHQLNSAACTHLRACFLLGQLLPQPRRFLFSSPQALQDRLIYRQVVGSTRVLSQVQRRRCSFRLATGMGLRHRFNAKHILSKDVADVFKGVQLLSYASHAQAHIPSHQTRNRPPQVCPGAG